MSIIFCVRITTRIYANHTCVKLIVELLSCTRIAHKHELGTVEDELGRWWTIDFMIILL